MSRNPLIWELTTPEFRVENGEVEAPCGPGLGVELIPDAELKYPYIPGPMYR
jgi:L-alanine-DL-glutamate epimerase-like enolase superfamily enzyme